MLLTYQKETHPCIYGHLDLEALYRYIYWSNVSRDV